jgi:hypothetical protein
MVVDLYVIEASLQPVNGAYVLSVVGARCTKRDGCAVGGNVLLLMQPSGDITVEDVTGDVIPFQFDDSTQSR